MKRPAKPQRLLTVSLPLALAFGFAGLVLLLLAVLQSKPMLPPLSKGLISQASPSPTATALELYPRSFDLFEIRLGIPKGWEVMEGETYIDLKIGDESITVVRNATNFEGIDAYLENFDSLKRTLTVQDEEKSTINGLPTISRLEDYSTQLDVRVYHFYTPFMVYSLSTSDQELFSALDQIAQTFEFTGE